MESARLPFSQPRLGPARGSLIALLLVLALVGWVLTDERMAGMDAGPGTDLGGIGFYITVWVVMMAAMMFPSISPMVSVYARLQRGRREKGMAAPAGATAIFVAGYIVTWTLAGFAAYLLFALGRELAPAALAWDRGGPYLAGGVIAGAAIYQLTPLKDACLRRCRGPLSFVIENWRGGRIGALRMGMLHGTWCVGCCWALMAVLFALGAMSVGWMAFVAGLIAIEKLLPWQAVANRSIAIVLVALGLAVASVPEDVPGLTTPNSPEATRAMQGMEAMPADPAMTDDGMPADR